MKNIRINRPTAYILIIIISLIIGIIIGTIVINHRNNANPNSITANEHFVYLDTYTEAPISSPLDNQAIVFTTYEEYHNVFEKDALTEKDFKNNNYVLIPMRADSCSETDMVPTSYKIKDNKIIVNVSYKASCNSCAKEYVYYLLEVEKTLTDVELEIEYKSTNNPHCETDVEKKPLIYIYPEKETDITITLGHPELIITSYPKYKESWHLKAYPDGTLIDANNREYYGLYWEGSNHYPKMTAEGFVVAGTDTIPFLEEKLAILGLNEKEADEFIIYWLPKLEHNKYNYIRFESLEEINDYMPLTITPEPNTLIRIIMDYKPLDTKIEVKEQTLIPKTRNGYSVIEWGGSEIK